MGDQNQKDPEVILEDDEGGQQALADKIKKVKEQLKLCQQEKQDNLAGWQRAQADFINYRRRQEEQMSEWSKMFGEGLLRDILPVLDTLDASEKETTSSQPSPSKEGGESGLKLVREQLMKILSKHGLMEMKAVGEKFDPTLHEAVEQVTGEKEDLVAEEIQKGYLLNGKVIRVAKVKVTK